MSNVNRIARFLPKEEPPPESCFECHAPVKWETGKHSSDHKHGCSRHYPCLPECPCSACGGTGGMHHADKAGPCDNDPDPPPPPRKRKKRK